LTQTLFESSSSGAVLLIRHSRGKICMPCVQERTLGSCPLEKEVLVLCDDGVCRMVNLDEIRVGDRRVALDATGGIIDSGTTVILLGEDDAVAIHKVWSTPAVPL
jgi:hypothetical protein